MVLSYIFCLTLIKTFQFTETFRVAMIPCYQGFRDSGKQSKIVFNELDNKLPMFLQIKINGFNNFGMSGVYAYIHCLCASESSGRLFLFFLFVRYLSTYVSPRRGFTMILIHCMPFQVPKIRLGWGKKTFWGGHLPKIEFEVALSLLSSNVQRTSINETVYFNKYTYWRLKINVT